MGVGGNNIGKGAHAVDLLLESVVLALNLVGRPGGRGPDTSVGAVIKRAGDMWCRGGHGAGKQLDSRCRSQRGGHLGTPQRTFLWYWMRWLMLCWPARKVACMAWLQPVRANGCLGSRPIALQAQLPSAHPPTSHPQTNTCSRPASEPASQPSSQQSTPSERHALSSQPPVRLVTSVSSLASRCRHACRSVSSCCRASATCTDGRQAGSRWHAGGGRHACVMQPSGAAGRTAC